jgi:hypothetical protein
MLRRASRCAAALRLLAGRPPVRDSCNFRSGGDTEKKEESGVSPALYIAAELVSSDNFLWFEPRQSLCDIGRNGHYSRPTAAVTTVPLERIRTTSGCRAGILSVSIFSLFDRSKS